MTDIEWLTERAAILEYDAGLTRPEADRMAAEMLQTHVTARAAAKTARGHGYVANAGLEGQKALW